MDQNFWRGIEDLGLDDVAVSRSARVSAPGGLSSSIPVIPASHPSASAVRDPTRPPPSILTAQQQHVYANSSPASPAGLDGAGRHLAARMSSPGHTPLVPLPAPGEQHYKELYDSLEHEEAAAEAATEAGMCSDDMYADVREGAALQMSPMKKRLGMSMRRPLVLSLNVSMNKDHQLQQEQMRHAASMFKTFRKSSSGEHDMSSTGRLATSAGAEPSRSPAAPAPVAPTPPQASRLSNMNLGAPLLPPKTPLITSANTKQPVTVKTAVSQNSIQGQGSIKERMGKSVLEIDLDRVDPASDKIMQWVSNGVADFRSPRTSLPGLPGHAEAAAAAMGGMSRQTSIRPGARSSSVQRSGKHTGVFL